MIVFDAGINEESGNRELGENRMISLYVHVPFCKQKCSYCDFLSWQGFSHDWMKEYVRCLRKELSFYKGYMFSTIYIGGGTPSVLPLDCLKELLESINHYTDMTVVKEYTVELNPESTDKSKLALLREFGVQRFSFGVQSFSDEVLKAMHRPTRYRDIERVLSLVSTFNIENYNLDLILGIQKPFEFKVDLAKAVEANPSHISVYMLHVSPGTPLSARIRSGLFTPLSDNLYEQCYLYAVDYLLSYGYTQYEISNFAKPGFESLHNINYWQGGTWIGIGVGAVTNNRGLRWTNESSLEKYCAFVKDNLLPHTNKEKIDQAKRFVEKIILSLRTREGIRFSTLKKAVLTEKLESFQNFIKLLFKKEYIEMREDRFIFTPRGFLHFNTIVSELLWLME